MNVSRVTQRVDPSSLDGLVAGPPRAAIAFVQGTRVEAVPVALHRDGERIWIGIDPSVLPGSETSAPAVALVDDGRYWFELRAITWRGRLVPGTAPATEPPNGLRWFEFLADSSVSWDYATLHEEP